MDSSWSALREELGASGRSRVHGVDALLTLVKRQPLERGQISELLDISPALLKDSNTKVAQQMLEAWEAIVKIDEQQLRPYASSIIALVGECLGDSSPAMRQRAITVLVSLLSKLQPEYVLQQLSSFWSHENNTVRAGLARGITDAVARLGGSVLTGRDQNSSTLRRIVQQTQDRDRSVREGALSCLIDLHKQLGCIVGEAVRHSQLPPDIQQDLLLHLDDDSSAHLASCGSSSAGSGSSLLSGSHGPRSVQSCDGRTLTTSSAAVSSTSAVRPGGGGRTAVEDDGSVQVSARRPVSATASVIASAPKRGGYKDGGGVSLDGELPVVSAIHINSDKELRAELEQLTAVLAQAPNADWNERMAAMARVEGLVAGGAVQYEAFGECLKLLTGALGQQFKERRSIIARQTCHLLSSMAAALGPRFESSALAMLPVMFTVLVITVQVMAESAHECIVAMLEQCQTAKVMALMTEAVVREKNPKTRQSCAQYVVQMLEQWEPSVWIRHTEGLDAAIKAASVDLLGETRSAGRAAFAAYHAAAPEKANALLKKLDASLADKLAASVAGNNMRAGTTRPATSAARPSLKAAIASRTDLPKRKAVPSAPADDVLIMVPPTRPTRPASAFATPAARPAPVPRLATATTEPSSHPLHQLIATAATPNTSSRPMQANVSAAGAASSHAAAPGAMSQLGAANGFGDPSTAPRKSALPMAGRRSMGMPPGRVPGGSADFTALFTEHSTPVPGQQGREQQQQRLASAVQLANGQHHYAPAEFALAGGASIVAAATSNGGGLSTSMAPPPPRPATSNNNASMHSAAAMPPPSTAPSGSSTTATFSATALNNGINRSASIPGAHGSAPGLGFASLGGYSGYNGASMVGPDGPSPHDWMDPAAALAEQQRSISGGGASSVSHGVQLGPAAAMSSTTARGAGSATSSRAGSSWRSDKNNGSVGGSHDMSNSSKAPITAVRAVAALAHLHGQSWVEKVGAFKDVTAALVHAAGPAASLDGEVAEAVAREVGRQHERFAEGLEDAHGKVHLHALAALKECLQQGVARGLEPCLDRLMLQLFRFTDQKETARSAEEVLAGVGYSFRADALLPCLNKALDNLKTPGARLEVLHFFTATIGNGTAAGRPTNQGHLRHWLQRLAPLFDDKAADMRKAAKEAVALCYSNISEDITRSVAHGATGAGSMPLRAWVNDLSVGVLRHSSSTDAITSHQQQQQQQTQSVARGSPATTATQAPTHSYSHSGSAPELAQQHSSYGGAAQTPHQGANNARQLLTSQPQHAHADLPPAATPSQPAPMFGYAPPSSCLQQQQQCTQQVPASTLQLQQQQARPWTSPEIGARSAQHQQQAQLMAQLQHHAPPPSKIDHAIGQQQQYQQQQVSAYTASTYLSPSRPVGADGVGGLLRFTSDGAELSHHGSYSAANGNGTSGMPGSAADVQTAASQRMQLLASELAAEQPWTSNGMAVARRSLPSSHPLTTSAAAVSRPYNANSSSASVTAPGSPGKSGSPAGSLSEQQRALRQALGSAREAPCPVTFQALKAAVHACSRGACTNVFPQLMVDIKAWAEHPDTGVRASAHDTLAEVIKAQPTFFEANLRARVQQLLTGMAAEEAEEVRGKMLAALQMLGKACHPQRFAWAVAECIPPTHALAQGARGRPRTLVLLRAALDAFRDVLVKRLKRDHLPPLLESIPALWAGAVVASEEPHDVGMRKAGIVTMAGLWYRLGDWLQPSLDTLTLHQRKLIDVYFLQEYGIPRKGAALEELGSGADPAGLLTWTGPAHEHPYCKGQAPPVPDPEEYEEAGL